MAVIISVSNNKGGVGKTTTAAALGAGIARKSKRVLLVDMDSQCNLSQSFRVSGEECDSYQVLKGGALKPEKVSDYLFILPASKDLAAIDMELAREPGREQLLKEALDKIGGEFDYIVIDTPPSVELATLNALTASDFVLLPMEAHYLAAEGLAGMLEYIGIVQRRINSKLAVLGVALVRYSARKTLHRQVRASIEKSLPVFKSTISESIAIAEAPAMGLDLYSYAPESKAAREYAALIDEVLQAIEK